MTSKPHTVEIAAESIVAFVLNSAVSAVCLYNFGRITTYSLLGALAGGVGSVAWLMQTMLPVQQIAFFTSNVLLILMHLSMMTVS